MRRPAAVFILAAAVCMNGGCRPPFATTPEAAFASFQQALADADRQRVLQVLEVPGANPDATFNGLLMSKAAFLDATVTDEKTIGDVAGLVLDSHGHLASYLCVKHGDRWYIATPIGVPFGYDEKQLAAAKELKQWAATKGVDTSGKKPMLGTTPASSPEATASP